MPSRSPLSPPLADPLGDAWVRCFHRGERAALARCYQEYVSTVAWAVGQVLTGVDRDTVVHEVFCRLFESPSVRENFVGGNFGAWLITVARRQAIDFCRRRDREEPVGAAPLTTTRTERTVNPDEALELRSLVERFRRILPPKWESVFRVRFLEQLDQRAAARQLGMRRTTLAYQELQIRKLLRQFVLEQDP